MSESAAGAALVVWGSTGRRLNFTKEDLAMPERLRQLPNAHFYEKQWDTVAGFWFNRVLKESALQHMSIDQVVSSIEADIGKRWQKRKADSNLHKRRKRLLQPGGPAGNPSNRVLVTNVVSLEQYLGSDDRSGSGGEAGPAREELLQALLEHVERIAEEKPAGAQVLVDAKDEVGGGGGNSGGSSAKTDAEAAPASKKARTETGKVEEGRVTSSGTTEEGKERAEGGSVAFDDRVAFVVELSSKEKAVTVVMGLHGKMFNERKLMCHFI